LESRRPAKAGAANGIARGIGNAVRCEAAGAGGNAASERQQTEQLSIQCLASSGSPEGEGEAVVPAWQLTPIGSTIASTAKRAAAKFAMVVDRAMMYVAAIATIRRPSEC
jgi:hypothetical protein